MKTTKSKKKVNSENQIQKIFKTAPTESIEPTSSVNVKSVYVHALLEKLKSFDDESDSNNESISARENSETVAIASTTQPTNDGVEVSKSNRFGPCEACGRVEKTNRCGECEKWRTKYEEVKKSQLKLSLRYTELMMKYEELVEVAKGTVRPNVNTEKKSDGASQTSSTSDIVASQTLSTSDGVAQSLSESDAIFTDNELKYLKCLPLDQNKDSTFILNCVRYAYKNNPASLTKKTRKGTRGRYKTNEVGDLVTVKPAKDPLTPEKVQRIQKLFIDRVTRSKCMAGQFGERVEEKNFNRLIADAVKNLSNKEAPKKVPSNKNADLNL